jgi:hypothetical protein
MKAKELFLPIGWLDLSKEQAEKIKSELGKDIDKVPVYSVSSVSDSDCYVAINGVPGLSGVIVHYGPQAEVEEPGSNLIAAVLDDIEKEMEGGQVFAAHTKLLAARAESAGAKSAESKSAKAK